MKGEVAPGTWFHWHDVPSVAHWIFREPRVLDSTVIEDLPHLPFYVNPPGEFDTLLMNVGIFLVILVILVGVLYLSLHAIPERMSHGRVQMELVAVMALVGLLTHNTTFWILALLLAVVRIPDFGRIFSSMAVSLRRLASPDATPAERAATEKAEAEALEDKA